MDKDKPDHDKLIDAIYGCALNPEGWVQTLDRIRQYLGASAFNLIDLEVGALDNPLIYASNLPLDQGHVYRDNWLSHDPWVKGLTQKGLDLGGITYCGSQLLNPEELVKTPFYNDWLVGQDIKDVLGANLWGLGRQWDRDPEDHRIVLGFYRSRADEAFSETDRQKLEGLSRHLNRAFQITFRMGRLVHNECVSEAVLKTLCQAVIVLDANSRILAANPAGNRRLEQTPLQLQVHNGHLTGFVGELSPSLDEAMARSRNEYACLLHWRTTTPEDNSGLVTLRLAPLNASVIPGFSGQRTVFILIIEAGNEIDDAAFQSFCGLYHIMPAEQKVLRMLMLDNGNDAIASSLKISSATVRTHIQNIRYKVGVRRISDVVAMAFAATRTT